MEHALGGAKSDPEDRLRRRRLTAYVRAAQPWQRVPELTPGSASSGKRTAVNAQTKTPSVRNQVVEGRPGCHNLGTTHATLSEGALKALRRHPGCAGQHAGADLLSRNLKGNTKLEGPVAGVADVAGVA